LADFISQRPLAGQRLAADLSRYGGIVKLGAFSHIILAVALLVAALPAVAHHGTLVSYDRDKQWTREVVVTRFNYANPHPQIFFDLTEEGGDVVHWAGELLPNPAALLRVGWTKARSLQALAPGTKINITIAPARAGGVVGLVLRMRSLDGADVVSDTVPYPEATAAPAQP
jgi:hypothetical protein